MRRARGWDAIFRRRPAERSPSTVSACAPDPRVRREVSSATPDRSMMRDCRRPPPPRATLQQRRQGFQPHPACCPAVSTLYRRSVRTGPLRISPASRTQAENPGGGRPSTPHPHRPLPRRAWHSRPRGACQQSDRGFRLCRDKRRRDGPAAPRVQDRRRGPKSPGRVAPTITDRPLPRPGPDREAGLRAAWRGCILTIATIFGTIPLMRRHQRRESRAAFSKRANAMLRIEALARIDRGHATAVAERAEEIP